MEEWTQINNSPNSSSISTDERQQDGALWNVFSLGKSPGSTHKHKCQKIAVLFHFKMVYATRLVILYKDVCLVPVLEKMGSECCPWGRQLVSRQMHSKELLLTCSPIEDWGYNLENQIRKQLLSELQILKLRVKLRLVSFWGLRLLAYNFK